MKKNNHDSFRKELLNFAEKLNNLESDNVQKAVRLQELKGLQQRLDDKLNYIKQNQDNIITIIIGETKFNISKKTIINCKYDNTLKDIIISNDKTNMENNDIYYLDFSDYIFEALLDIIRNNQTNIKIKYPFMADFRPKVYGVYEDEDSSIFKEEIKRFFYNNGEDIIKKYFNK
jgi:hypothetical protein